MQGKINLSVLFFPGWRATFVLRTVPRNGIWAFGKIIRRGRHVFFFPRMKVINAKLILIGEISKPITTLLLFTGCFTKCALRMTPSWR